jgi:hypothetical protein
VGYREEQILLIRGGESKSYLLLKCPGTQRWREELLKSKWPEINEEIVIRKILTVKNATEQRKLMEISG